MTLSDFSFIFQWWITIFFIGISCIPLMLLLFPNFFDKGYVFGKVTGIILLSYLTLLFGELHIVFFSQFNVIFLLLLLAIVNLIILIRNLNILSLLKKAWKFFILEEIIFFLGLWSWSFVRATAPDIHGLEKFMDYGFVNSILRSSYFPPKDMWYPPFPINYYYFGHFSTAVLSKISNIPSEISFNLMLATLFAFTLTCSFSLGANFLLSLREEKSLKNQQTIRRSYYSFKSLAITAKVILGAILTAFLTTFAGNLHTIYSFFKPYENENPVPFWQKPFSLSTFPNSYWYPNATRFIFHTIHEFPIYSFVVSDLHGHVLDIPFVLLTIAIIFSFFTRYREITSRYKLAVNIGLGFLIAVMYMTNAWDGIIYFLLIAFVVFFLNFSTAKNTGNILKSFWNKDYLLNNLYYLSITFISFIVFSLPFSLFFKPFASQIGILCAPKFLTNIGHLGPFLFEPDHCQHSPFYQLFILHGFFLFWVLSFAVFLFLQRKKTKPYPSDIFVILLSLLSILLIIIPEFVYLKDIYPAHYRANTMFKLVYQSFIMLSLCSGYIIIRLISSFKLLVSNFKSIVLLVILVGLGSVSLLLVSIYPYFAINSYYNNLQVYYGLDGTKYLQRLYPTDYDAINWLNKNTSGQPVILEAQGDSYTDYARISANTGLPTPLGWTVHEWLWRGSYDPLPERINDIQRLYETNDVNEAKTLSRKYNVSLVFVGDMERKKYTNLNDNKFLLFGKVIFEEGTTKIYKIEP